jgi:predicted nuclease of predicted toxin-antitoxin system
MSSAPELLLDENLSWRVARGLREHGYSITTISEAHLTSRGDRDVFQYAQAHRLAILTRDDDFRTQFAPPHAGIIVIQAPSGARNADILSCLLLRLSYTLAQSLNDRIQIIIC